MRYVLEIQGWTDWEVERTFDTLEVAYTYAKDRFSHNIWRVIDCFVSNEVMFEHDPTIAFEELAINDIERFARRDRWMTQRAAMPRMQQRQRMGRIASRQRQRQVAMSRAFLLRDMEEFDTDLIARHDKVDWRREGF